MFRIGVVSAEKHRAGQVAAIFPEWKLQVEQVQFADTLLAENLTAWDAIVFDLDVLETESSNVGEFLENAANHSHHVIVLVPSRLMHLEPGFASRGMYILRKPTSSSEIALALRMLLRDL